MLVCVIKCFQFQFVSACGHVTTRHAHLLAPPCHMSRMHGVCKCGCLWYIESFIPINATLLHPAIQITHVHARAGRAANKNDGWKVTHRSILYQYLIHVYKYIRQFLITTEFNNCFFLGPVSLPCTTSLYERALSVCELEYRSFKLWDSYISWEKANGTSAHITTIYDRVLATPTQQLQQHFDRYSCKMKALKVQTLSTVCLCYEHMHCSIWMLVWEVSEHVNSLQLAKANGE